MKPSVDSDTQWVLALVRLYLLYVLKETPFPTHTQKQVREKKEKGGSVNISKASIDFLKYLLIRIWPNFEKIKKVRLYKLLSK
jgi:hypothetical protein